MTTGEQLLTETSAVGFRVAPMEASTRAEVDEANGLMVVRGVPATVLDTRDANGRIHPRESFERALRQLKKEGAFASRSLLCTADDHPEQSYPRPAKASHIVVDARIESGEGGGSPRVVNDWLVLNTSAGKDLRALIEAGATIGTSIRGLGRQDEDSGQIEDHTYLGTDAVGQPSAGTFASFATLTAEAAPPDVARAVVESLETGRMTCDVDEALDRFCEQWGVDDAALAAGTAPLPVAAVDEFLAIETQAAKEGVEPTARYEALRPGMPGVIAAARKIVDEGKRDGIPGHEGEDDLRSGRASALGEGGANPAPMGHASAALRGTAATVAIRQRVVPGGLTESTQLIVLERTNIHLRHSLREAEQERQRHLAERNAAVAERDAIRAEIEGVRGALAEMTAERDGLVAAGTDVLDEGVERIDRFLEAARERVSALVDRLLDENERLGRRLAAAERVAAAQAEIAESLLDRVEGDVLEAVATDPALAAPAPAPVVSASASLADRLAKRRDFRQDPDMRGWT